jgi:hypothetical protein
LDQFTLIRPTARPADPADVELVSQQEDVVGKKVAATKIYFIQRLYNLQMKESDSITAHLNDYEGIIS